MDLEDQFLRLCVRQLAVKDFDAEHPVCLWIAERLRLDQTQRSWLSFLYMAFYDEASAWVCFREADPYVMPPRLDLPIGTNRRNLFGSGLRRHFESLFRCRQLANDWPTHNFLGDPKRDWDILRGNLAAVWGNGRFGVYTTAEMLQKVAGVPVEITGFDNDHSSGPADGARRIYGCSKDLSSLNAATDMAWKRLQRTGLSPRYTQLDRGVVESLLCNFGALCRGRFYSGRNIDRQQGRIQRVEEITNVSLDILWQARASVFRAVDLGEANGWNGIDKARLKHYQLHGEMLWPNEGR